MDEFEAKCCVCLTLSPLCRKISAPGAAPIIAKLQTIAPEVEWLADYNICQGCGDRLEQACEFRDLCLRMDEDRTAALAPKTENFTCFDCGACYDDKEILIKHIYGHQKTKKVDAMTRFECISCDKTYTTKKILRAHLKKCNKDTKKRRKFSCEVCGLELNHAKDIIQHCVSLHGMDTKSVKPYTCVACPMRFATSANLIQHKKYHEGSRSHICSFCGKSYITKSDLTVHEYTHFNRRNYKCASCAKAFNTNKNLRSHLLVVHTDPALWKYGCELCGRRFPLKSGHAQHVKRHTGDKGFACRFHACDKAFVSRSELQKHMRFHSTVKPFRCEHCDRAYKERRLLEVHLARDHGIGDARVPVKAKKHACDACPALFCDRQKLERHLRTHTGVKPYACAKCEKKFSDKYYLKQHLKNVHGVEEEEIIGGLQ